MAIPLCVELFQRLRDSRFEGQALRRVLPRTPGQLLRPVAGKAAGDVLVVPSSVQTKSLPGRPAPGPAACFSYHTAPPPVRQSISRTFVRKKIENFTCILPAFVYNELRQLNTTSSGRGAIPHWRYSPRTTSVADPVQLRDQRYSPDERRCVNFTHTPRY